MKATYDALIAWVAAMSGVTTYVRFPNAPPPPKPNVALRIIAKAQQTSESNYGDTDDTVNRWYGFTLSMQVYGRNDLANILEAEKIAAKIEDNLTDQLLRNTHLGKGLSLVQVLSSVDTTTTIGTEYEPRYTIDLQMNGSREVILSAGVGEIQRWEVEGIVNEAVDNEIIIDGEPVVVNYRQVAVESEIDGYTP